MNKFLAIGGGVVVAAGLGWTGLWYAGRGAVTQQLDAELARMAASGTTLTSAGRSIGGFPLGYTVTLTDVVIDQPKSATKLALPSLVASAAVTDPRALSLAFPAQGRLTLAVPPDLRATNPALGTEFAMDIAADGLVTTIRPAASGERLVDTAAKSLRLTYAAPDQSATVAVTLADLVWQSVLPAQAGAAPTTGTGTVGRLDYQVATKTPEGAAMTASGDYTALQITTSTTVTDPADVQALLASGVVDLAYKSGPARVNMTVTGDPMGADGTLTGASGDNSGVIALKDGVFTAGGASVANTWTIASANPAMPVNGTATIARMDSTLTMPLRPSATLQPVALRLAVEGLVLDDAAWAQFDPGRALSRDPARIVFDLGGTARVTADLGTADPAGPPPFEFGPLELKAVELGLLGAGLSATGSVEFLAPFMIPTGAVSLTTTKALAAVDQLLAAGLLDGATAEMVRAMATVYAQPGPAPDTLVSDIVMSPDGAITVNGQPLQ